MPDISSPPERTEELMERMARAMLAVDGSWQGISWERVPDAVQALFLRDARAALQSLGYAYGERLEALHAEREKLRGAAQKMIDAVRAARNMVPDEEDGLAAQLFAYHINAADGGLIAALAIGETDYCGIVEDSPDAP